MAIQWISTVIQKSSLLLILAPRAHKATANVEKQYNVIPKTPQNFACDVLRKMASCQLLYAINPLLFNIIVISNQKPLQSQNAEKYKQKKTVLENNKCFYFKLNWCHLKFIMMISIMIKIIATLNALRTQIKPLCTYFILLRLHILIPVCFFISDTQMG